MLEIKLTGSHFATLLSMCCALSSIACVEDARPEGQADDVSALPDRDGGPATATGLGVAGPSVPIDELPVVEQVDTYVQLLEHPTERGENVAVHVELPPPHAGVLEDSLVRLLGEGDDPLILYRTDALVELGVVPESPGPSFYTSFVVLDASELDRREAIEASLAASASPSDQHVVFRGRTPVGLRMGVDFSSDEFLGGALAALGPCPIMPTSELAQWEESLLITDPAVVQEPSRTWDTCTGTGDPEGVWTFYHLMSEMAAGAVPAMSVEEFTLEWLETWLDPQIVNGDVIDARPLMFDLVIEPWAIASGETATLTFGGTGGTAEVVLSGPLDWEFSPFRLSAIVNRIDLGASGPGTGYGGGSVSNPQDAGELRFVFGVLDPGGCGVMPFSVIFEYGVPITGCDAVRDWAYAWTQLNDEPTLPRFGVDWLAHLEGLTQSVVTYAAAPSKGNKNAINQIRSNENALDGQWEFREFTLTIESTTTLPNDTPADGPLRPHSVAMTIDDTVFDEFTDPMVDSYVLSDVLPTVGTPVVLPTDCQSAYTVPLEHLGMPFRGGNSFTGPVDFWQAGISPSDPAELCARHEFSLNTCNGCHFSDTGTTFLHVDPQPMPAALSGFLTGGTGVLSVADPQFPSAVTWTFADLQRRYERLYEIACAPCATSIPSSTGAVTRIADIAGVVPIDRFVPNVDDPPIGPITSLAHVAQILAGEGVGGNASERVELGGFIRPAQTFVH